MAYLQSYRKMDMGRKRGDTDGDRVVPVRGHQVQSGKAAVASTQV